MKRIICFIILLIFAAIVFFTGWTQLKIKPGTCVILESKTNGLNRQAMEYGKFYWNWQFLLPTNTKLTAFEIKPYNTTNTFSGQISTGINNSLYEDILTYHFNYSISLSYYPESILKLKEENLISNQEDFETYLKNASQYFCEKASNYYLEKINENMNFKPESVKRNDLLNYINSYEDFPYIDITVLSLTDYKLPNYQLYEKLQSNSLIWNSSIYSDSSSKNNLQDDQENE